MESTMPTDTRHLFLEEHTATSQPFRFSRGAIVFVPAGTNTIDVTRQPPPASSHRYQQDTPAPSISTEESERDDASRSGERSVETVHDEADHDIANTDDDPDRQTPNDPPEHDSSLPSRQLRRVTIYFDKSLHWSLLSRHDSRNWSQLYCLSSF